MAVPIVIYKGKPKPHSWCRWMAGRVMRKNNNNLVSYVGPTGSGKTWAAIATAEKMSKITGVPFTVDNIIFSLIEGMRLINGGTLKRGSIIIFDEPQASISAKDFQQVANKVFNLLISTFRHRNISMFFCTPFESLLDRSTRRLFHARFETMSINPIKKTCKLKPRFLEYSDFKAEPYRKQMIVRYKDAEGINKSSKLFFWDVPKPSDEMIEQYEKKKLEFTSNLNKNIMYKLEKYEDSGKSMTAVKKEEVIERKPLTDIQLADMKCLANHKFIDAVKIRGKSLAALSKNKQLALKKGYTMEEFRDA